MGPYSQGLNSADDISTQFYVFPYLIQTSSELDLLEDSRLVVPRVVKGLVFVPMSVDCLQNLYLGLCGETQIVVR